MLFKLQAYAPTSTRCYRATATSPSQCAVALNQGAKRLRRHMLRRPSANGDDAGAPGPNPRAQALDLGLDPLAVPELLYGPVDRLVLDDRPADEFFEVPRIGVAHTDSGFTERLTALYRRSLEPLVGPSCLVVDLCSGADSHLPPDLQLGQVVGHGVNAAELAANPALTSSFLQDLNARTGLPLESGSAAAVLCCNGIQYLTRPEWVAAEVGRVLRPGGVAVVSFSGCCWAERAAAGWLSRGAEERVRLVQRLLENGGMRIQEVVRDQRRGPPASLSNGNVDHSSTGGTTGGGGEGDPLYAVVAVKPGASLDSRPEDLASELRPTDVATAMVGPALRELDLSSALVAPATLERWRASYSALVEDAADLGIPRSAIPGLAANSSAAQIRAARDDLQRMIESFLSAGL